MKMKTVALAIALTALTTGCTTYHASPQSANLATVNSNIKADVDVGESISGESRIITILGFINFGANKFADGMAFGGNSDFYSGERSVDEAKAAAGYNAISASNADVIVMPRYTIKVSNYVLFKTTNARVTGNKGVIKSYKAN